MNFVMSLAHYSLCGSEVKHQSVESKGVRLQFLMETQNFFFVPQQDEKHLSIFYKTYKNLQSFLFYLQNKRIVTRMTAPSF